MPTTRDRRLDPVRWPRPPRGVTVVRAALVAALLLTAAGVLYAAPAAPDGLAPRSTPIPTATPGDPAASRHPPGGQAPGGQAPGAGATPSPQTPAPPIGRLPLPPGAVGVPVRLTEPAALAVLRPGDRVDLLAVADEPRTDANRPDPPATIASGALVLAVPDPAGDPLDQAVVYLALSPTQARETVAFPPSVRFAVIVRS